MSNTNSNTNDLVTLNSSTLGAKFPEITLPDGSKVQTGTVGALLINIRKYNELHATQGTGDSNEIKAQLEALDGAFLAALPMLNKVGFFELFSVEEWRAEGGSVGRRRVGELAAGEREKAGGGVGTA